VRDAALPKRRTQTSAALQTALDAVARMHELGNLNEPDFQRLFSDSFRQKIPLVEVRRTLSEIRSRRGACRFERVLSAGANEARALMRCERGGELHIHLQITPIDHRIHYLVSGPGAVSEGDAIDRCSP
jgi:hypothetical protein